MIPPSDYSATILDNLHDAVAIINAGDFTIAKANAAFCARHGASQEAVEEIPTVKEALGADISYLMLRGIFGAPDMPKDALTWYVDFLRKVSETPRWKKYM